MKKNVYFFKTYMKKKCLFFYNTTIKALQPNHYNFYLQ